MRSRKINKPGSILLLMVDLRDAIVAALTWMSMVNLQETNVSSSSVFLLMALPVHLTAVAGLPSFSNSSSPINENLLFDLIIYRRIEMRFLKKKYVGLGNPQIR